MELKSFTPKSGIRGTAHRREKYFTSQVSCISMKNGELTESVILRCYRNSSTRVSFCLWIKDKKYEASGSGMASGYDVSSIRHNALLQTLQTAGIVLKDYKANYAYDISEMEAVMVAITDLLRDYYICNWDNYLIVTANG